MSSPLSAALHNEERIRRLLTLSCDWYWEQDENLVFTAIQAHNRRLTDWVSQYLGVRRWEVPYTNMTSADWDAHRAVLAARQPFRDLELCRLDHGRSEVWISTSGEPVFDSTGAFKGYRGVGRDITDRHRAQRALRESEQRFQAFMNNLPAVAWIKDSKLRYTYLNVPMEKVVGKGLHEILGRDDFEVDWPGGSAEMARAGDFEVLKALSAQQEVATGWHVDGRPHQWLKVKFPLPDATGAMGVAGVAVDITDRVHAQEQALKYSEQIKALYGRLMQTQEAERRRLASELHDLIGQNLTALGIDLAHLKSALPPGGPLASRIDSMVTLLDHTVDVVRGVMAELRPPALDEYGLVPALHWYATVFSGRTHMRVKVTATRDERLPPDTALTLFRIAQEALTNAAKHSQGRNVEISVRIDERRVELAVADDGIGFRDAPGARGEKRGGWGLPTMRERAEALGGAMRIELPARGTRVVVNIPLPHADQHPVT